MSIILIQWILLVLLVLVILTGLTLTGLGLRKWHHATFIKKRTYEEMLAVIPLIKTLPDSQQAYVYDEIEKLLARGPEALTGRNGPEILAEILRKQPPETDLLHQSKKKAYSSAPADAQQQPDPDTVTITDENDQ